MYSIIELSLGQYRNTLYLSVFVIALIAYFACSARIKTAVSSKKSSGLKILSIIGLALSSVEYLYTVYVILHTWLAGQSTAIIGVYARGIFSAVFWVYLVSLFIVLLAGGGSVSCCRLYSFIPVFFLINFALLWYLRAIMNDLTRAILPVDEMLPGFTLSSILFDMQFILYAAVIGILAFRLKKQHRISRSASNL